VCILLACIQYPVLGKQIGEDWGLGYIRLEGGEKNKESDETAVLHTYMHSSSRSHGAPMLTFRQSRHSRRLLFFTYTKEHEKWSCNELFLPVSSALLILLRWAWLGGGFMFGV
jgi:hypothetical protein